MYLSRKDIEKIAVDIFNKYKKQYKIDSNDMCRVEPERLIKNLLGLSVINMQLSTDQTILGMTSYDYVDIVIYNQNGTEDVTLDGKTILIEETLNEDVKKISRRNFTLLHEGSHQILKRLFPNDYAVNSHIHFCRKDMIQKTKAVDWEEWQANALASAILLPREALIKGMKQVGLNEKMSMLNALYNRKEYKKFEALAKYLGASKQALSIRMKQLGILENDYLEDPYSLTDIYC